MRSPSAHRQSSSDTFNSGRHGGRAASAHADDLDSGFPADIYLSILSRTLAGPLDSTSVTTTQGGSGTVTGTLTATADFSSNVSVSCSINPVITCSVTPSSVHLDAGAPQKFTVTGNGWRTRVAEGSPKAALRHGSSWKAMLSLLAAFGLACGILACGGGGATAGGSGGNWCRRGNWRWRFSFVHDNYLRRSSKLREPCIISAPSRLRSPLRRCALELVSTCPVSGNFNSLKARENSLFFLRHDDLKRGLTTVNCAAYSGRHARTRAKTLRFPC